MVSQSEILKKVRRIEIKTRGLSSEIFAGKYHSAFKGRGMSFSEVREYRVGDDVRDIDWNVSARSRSPHIKVYEEERELTLMLLVDVSASRLFGSRTMHKQELAAEMAAVLAFSAEKNGDKVGCLLFSDRVELFIPPKKGRNHILHIIRQLLEFEPVGRGTDIGGALRFATGALKKRTTMFVVSDMMDVDIETGKARFEEPLKILSSRHDVVALRLYDRRDESMPDVGAIEMMDAESGERVWVDTSSKEVRRAYDNHYKRQNFVVESTLMRYKVDTVAVATDDDYVKALIALFKKRG
ncbi:MAG: DUF58 domain-containing protein [Rikenellaceae bacterium]|nr:DUF58 domain-containing protein [Rikenellaceae bacterium]MDE7355163.1 DUF58 domain-containing protein [Rikenellaceae bacterium]